MLKTSLGLLQANNITANIPEIKHTVIGKIFIINIHFEASKGIITYPIKCGHIILYLYSW